MRTHAHRFALPDPLLTHALFMLVRSGLPMPCACDRLMGLMRLGVV